MHKLHFLVAGLNIVALSNIFQLISWSKDKRIQLLDALASNSCMYIQLLDYIQ